MRPTWRLVLLFVALTAVAVVVGLAIVAADQRIFYVVVPFP